MTENSILEKESNRLVEFLIEDLKETGEHLRDTDRKLSFLIQIYTGAFVLIASLSVNGVFNAPNLLDYPGLILIMFFVFFTWWLFIYALRSKETKAIYIRRMNFLRREMHYYLQSKHKDLPGYWTDTQLTKLTKQMLSSVSSPAGARKLKRVGLDDLYPIALQGILVLLSFAFAFVLATKISKQFTPNLDIWSSYLVAYVFFPVVIPIIWITIKQNKDSNASIQYQIETYKLSSEENDKNAPVPSQQIKVNNNKTKKRSSS